MIKMRQTVVHLAALALVAALSLPAAGRTHAAADTLVPNVGTDFVALINGGSVPFATRDFGAGSLPPGQPGWAPTSTARWGAMKLIDGHASRVGTNCRADCEWESTNGPTIITSSDPIDLVFTFVKQSTKTIDHVVLWQSAYDPAWMVRQYQVLVSTSALPLLTPADYLALKPTFKPVGTYTLTQQIGTGQRATFPPVAARYVMIRVLNDMSNGGGAALGEVQVFGPATAPGTATPGPTVSPGGALSIKFLSATVSGGGQQVAQVVAPKNALVGIVVDYPDGKQDVKQQKAGADGRLIYTWSVPKGVHGQATLTVVCGGKVASGTFTVN